MKPMDAPTGGQPVAERSHGHGALGKLGRAAKQARLAKAAGAAPLNAPTATLRLRDNLHDVAGSKNVVVPDSALGLAVDGADEVLP